MKNINKIIYSLTFIALATAAWAQADKQPQIITDRPDQTESPFVMPRGYFQLETGAIFSHRKSNDIKFKSKVYNTTLLRYGLNDVVEVRLIQNLEGAKNKYSDGSEVTVGAELSPTYLGAKFALAEEKGALPQIAFLAHIGGPVFTDQRTGFLTDFRFNFQHTLSDRFTLGYNLGGAWSDDFNTFQSLYTLVLGHSISSKLGAFLELYGFFPESSQPDHQIDGGFTYLVSSDIQIDLYGGFGLSEESPDGILGFGLSWRFPKK